MYRVRTKILFTIESDEEQVTQVDGLEEAYLECQRQHAAFQEANRPRRNRFRIPPPEPIQDFQDSPVVDTE